MHIGDFTSPIRYKADAIRRLLGGIDPCLEGLQLYDLGLPGQAVQVKTHAAADGGRAVDRLQGLTVYLIRGYAAAWSYTSNGYRMLGEHVEADLGLVRPPEREETRVSIYSDILEIYSLLQVIPYLSRGGLVLGDGSIISLIVEPRLEVAARQKGGVQKVVGEAAQQLGYEDTEALIDALEEETKTLGPLASRRLTGVDESSGDVKPFLPGLEHAYIEYLEKLLLIRQLLRTAWENGLTLVYISKTSRTSFLYPGNSCGFPDVQVISRLSPVNPGLFAVEPVQAGINSPLWAPSEPGTASTWAVAPPDTGLAGFYQDLRVYRFYVRLAPAAQVLKVEIPLPAREVDVLGNRLPEAMKSLARSVSQKLLGLPLASGYPVSLRRIHERAKLSRSEAEAVLEGLGVSYMVGGREVVE